VKTSTQTQVTRTEFHLLAVRVFGVYFGWHNSGKIAFSGRSWSLMIDMIQKRLSS
jgi:hypothetical protein